MSAVFGPPDDLIPVVDTGRETVVAAERWEGGHLAVAQYEAAADTPIGDKEDGEITAPILPEGLRFRSLGDSDDNPVIIVIGPCDRAVRSTKGAEVYGLSALPKLGVHRRVG
jgi:hypothetical protein